MKKRSAALRLFYVFIFMMLVLRVFYISYEKGAQYKSLANKQSFLSVSAENKRNDIIDRNGKAITGLEKNTYVILFSSNDNKSDFKFSKLISQYTDEDAYSIYSSLYKNRRVILKLNDKKDFSELRKYKNIMLTELNSRYLSDYPAAAIVGYLADGTGVSGMEYVYNEILSDSDSGSYGMFSDPKNNLYGDIRKNKSNNSIKLKTTINLDYQRICDDVLKKFNRPSAVALIGVNDFQLYAMSSYPTFRQDKIADYLGQENGSLSNRCLQNYDMGSIFKIVVAAAALENGLSVSEKLYDCSGCVYVHDQKFECHNIYGHQNQNMMEAFANSCNPAFIDIGNRIGYTKILDMAQKFGFGSKIFMPVEVGYDATIVPDRENYYLSDLANISIGQGRLNCNVVQGAVLSAVIANGGQFRNVESVLGIVDKDNKLIKSTLNNAPKRIVSRITAEKIKKMMLYTCTSGTGTSANLDFVGAGGKTGSAQTGWLVNGELYQHAWFTGFFPADNPEFALCVLVENGKSGSETAAPVFKEIGDRIMNLNE